MPVLVNELVREHLSHCWHTRRSSRAEKCYLLISWLSGYDQLLEKYSFLKYFLKDLDYE